MITHETIEELRRLESAWLQVVAKEYRWAGPELVAYEGKLLRCAPDLLAAAEALHEIKAAAVEAVDLRCRTDLKFRIKDIFDELECGR